jgi:putative peptidoglycan binding protein
VSLRTKSIALLVTAAVGGGVAFSAAPASASTSSGYISGSGPWSDDWGDEGPISTSSYSYSNAAAGWQAILWADGYFSSTSQIDCAFGSGTKTATEDWQRDEGLSADGVAGSHTLAKAETYMSESSDSGGYLTIVYHGVGGRYVTYTRNTDGQWGMYIGSDHHLLAYTYADFNNC